MVSSGLERWRRGKEGQEDIGKEEEEEEEEGLTFVRALEGRMSDAVNIFEKK